MRYGELKKKLRKAGCYKVREGGNHEIWINPQTEKKFQVGRHDSEEVPIGTLRNILKAAGI